MQPLKGQFIEATPKRVNFAKKFHDEVGISSNAQLLVDFNELQDHIHNGWTIPSRFYRLGVGKTPDLLLRKTGVKHLHLGGSASDVLVYLLELDDRVIIVRIADHRFLEDRPRGIGLFRLLGLRHPYLKK